MVEKYIEIQAFISLLIIDLFYRLKHLKYSQTGDVTFPLLFTISSQSVLLSFSLHFILIFFIFCNRPW